MNGLRRALGLVAVEGIVVGLVALAIVLSSDHVEGKAATAVAGAVPRVVVDRRRPLRVVAEAGQPLRRADDRRRLRLLPDRPGQLGLAAAVHDRRALLEPLPGRLRSHAARLPGRADRVAAAAPCARGRLRACAPRADPHAHCSPTPTTSAASAPSRRPVSPTPRPSSASSTCCPRRSRSCWSATSSTSLVKRWQDATQPQRSAMAPVLWSGICLLFAARRLAHVDGSRRARGRLDAMTLLALVLFALDALRRSCSGSCARASCGPARSRSCCTGSATRPTTAAGCATCSPRRSAIARSRSSTGSKTSAAGSTPPGAPPRCPPKTTPPARSRAWSARAAPSARSCTTARCARSRSSSARSRPRPASRSRTSACRPSCARGSRSCAPPARGSSRREPRSAAGSSATCTTAPSSGSSRSR